MLDKRTIKKLSFADAVYYCRIKKNLEFLEHIHVEHTECDRGTIPDCRGCTTMLKYECLVSKWIEKGEDF